MFKLVVLAALVLAVKVSAQKPCCGPMQFMAGNGATVGQVDPSLGAEGFFVYQYGAFDFSRRRFGYNMSVSYTNGTELSYRLIQKYEEGYQWIILDEAQYCLKQPTTYPEPAICIPRNAIYTGSAILGGPKGLTVDAFTYKFSRPKDPIDGTTFIDVVQGSCYPAGATFIGARYSLGTAVPFVSSGSILNMTLGISHPDKWFTVPAFCNQQENDNHISSRRPRSLPYLDYFHVPHFF